MKMSKKFDRLMSIEYTIVFALALSTICAVVTHVLGLQPFNLKYFIFETVFAIAIAWLAVCVFPIFDIGNALATKIFKKQPPSQGYMLFMSAGICSILIPCICLCMCSLIVGYKNDLNFTIIWNGFLMFAGPVYIVGIILVQILGKPLFKIAIKILGDEAFEKPEEESAFIAAEEIEEDVPRDLSVERGGEMDGKWRVINTSPVGKNELLYDIEQRGEAIYGKVNYEGKSAIIREGQYKDGEFSFRTTLVMPFGKRDVLMKGTIFGGALEGTSTMDERDTPLKGSKV